jgi:hypothetical protein
MLGRASGSGTGCATATAGVEACAAVADDGAAAVFAGPFPVVVSFELGAAEV